MSKPVYPPNRIEHWFGYGSDLYNSWSLKLWPWCPYNGDYSSYNGDYSGHNCETVINGNGGGHDDGDEDIKNNAWVTVNNDFWVTSEAICQ